MIYMTAVPYHFSDVLHPRFRLSFSKSFSSIRNEKFTLFGPFVKLFAMMALDIFLECFGEIEVATLRLFIIATICHTSHMVSS